MISKGKLKRSQTKICSSAISLQILLEYTFDEAWGSVVGSQQLTPELKFCH
jgi:hypothetical protein